MTFDTLSTQLAWLAYMQHAPPGTIIWLPLIDTESNKIHFCFIIREKSSIIQNLFTLPNGTIPLNWRMAVFNIEVARNKRVAFVELLVKIRGNLSETNINVLYVDDDVLESLKQPVLLRFLGDSGQIERNVLFPPNPDLYRAVSLARDKFEQSSWTDEDFNYAKQIIEHDNSLSELWEKLATPTK